MKQNDSTRKDTHEEHTERPEPKPWTPPKLKKLDCGDTLGKLGGVSDGPSGSPLS